MKVHFASTPGDEKYLSLGNVNYSLFSYHYLKDKPFPNASIEYMNQCQHAILDSGLFTMMFGAEKHIKRSEQDLVVMLDTYCDWIARSGYIHAAVEYDVQKIFSPELAWELRKRMKSRITNTIINVYHLEDQSPDPLIEFSDYVAVSVPELRKHVSRKELVAIGDYILKKALRKGIKVHMLGCTDKNLMKRWRDAFSCDSTSWKTMTQFNNLKISSDVIPILKKEIVYEHHKTGRFSDSPKSMTAYYYSIKAMLLEYEMCAGSQA